MITKLDWYILKKFLTTFFFCMLLFTVLAVAVDSSEKTDDFVNSGLSSTEIFKQYYIGFIPWIWGLLYPLFVFIAVIFFTSKMALRSEVIAILASGTSYMRWLKPYLIGGLFLAVILWLANAYLLPRATEIRSVFDTKYIHKREGNSSTNSVFRRLDSVTYAGLREYDTVAKSARPFYMQKVRNNKIFYNLRAQEMHWEPAKKVWLASSVVERWVDSMGERLKESAQMELRLNLKPEELRQDEFLKDRLTSPELNEFIRKEEARMTEGLNALKVEQYRRTATPFTVILLTLIGAIIAGRKSRGGSGLHMAIGIIIAAVFIIADKFSTVFSVKGNLHPFLAAWLPNMVFSLVGIYLYRRSPK